MIAGTGPLFGGARESNVYAKRIISVFVWERPLCAPKSANNDTWTHWEASSV